MKVQRVNPRWTAQIICKQSVDLFDGQNYEILILLGPSFRALVMQRQEVSWVRAVTFPKLRSEMPSSVPGYQSAADLIYQSYEQTKVELLHCKPNPQALPL